MNRPPGAQTSRTRWSTRPRVRRHAPRSPRCSSRTPGDPSRARSDPDRSAHSGAPRDLDQLGDVDAVGLDVDPFSPPAQTSRAGSRSRSRRRGTCRPSAVDDRPSLLPVVASPSSPTAPTASARRSWDHEPDSRGPTLVEPPVRAALTPHLAHAPRSGDRGSSVVEPFDLGGEVLLARAPLQLQRRGELVVGHREVAPRIVNFLICS